MGKRSKQKKQKQLAVSLNFNYRVFFCILVLPAILVLVNSCKQSEVEEEVSFSSHIAGIIHTNCTPCHRPGQAGPFSLITYKDVKKRANMIKEVTESRFMPPWPADPSYSHFIGERVLSKADIALIQEWVRSGAPIGDSTLIPKAPVYPEGSHLGEPDLVVKMREPVKILGNNSDTFLVIKLPFEIPKDTFIRAVEFIPGNRALVHHMNGQMVTYPFDKKATPFVGEDVVDADYISAEEAYNKISLLNDDGTYPGLTPNISNYLPGVLPPVYPEEIGGYRISRKGAFLLRNIHYGPSAVDTFDQSSFNVFFARKAPKRQLMETQLGTLGISDIVPELIIPPDTVMKFVTRAKIFNDISLLTINPHMHLIGRKFLAYAITAEQDTIPLIRINDWDFRWQYFYTFPKMLKIPGGSEIVVEGLFDNTSNNPFNPYDPPQTVREPASGDMKTFDEMFQFIINFLPYQEGDENISLENVSLYE